jgi:hypothetical protein
MCNCWTPFRSRPARKASLASSRTCLGSGCVRLSVCRATWYECTWLTKRAGVGHARIVVCDRGCVRPKAGRARRVLPVLSAAASPHPVVFNCDRVFRAEPRRRRRDARSGGGRSDGRPGLLRRRAGRTTHPGQRGWVRALSFTHAVTCTYTHGLAAPPTRRCLRIHTHIHAHMRTLTHAPTHPRAPSNRVTLWHGMGVG